MVTLGWCEAPGSQSLLMSKETLQSLPAVLALPYGQARLQHRTRLTVHDQLTGPSLPEART